MLLTGKELDGRTRKTGYLRTAETALVGLEAAEAAQEQEDPSGERVAEQMLECTWKLARAILAEDGALCGEAARDVAALAGTDVAAEQLAADLRMHEGKSAKFT